MVLGRCVGGFGGRCVGGFGGRCVGGFGEMRGWFWERCVGGFGGGAWVVLGKVRENILGVGGFYWV